MTTASSNSCPPPFPPFRLGLFLLCIPLGGLLGGLIGLIALPVLAGGCWTIEDCNEVFVWSLGLFTPFGVIGGLAVLGPIIYLIIRDRERRKYAKQHGLRWVPSKTTERPSVHIDKSGALSEQRASENGNEEA